METAAVNSTRISQASQSNFVSSFFFLPKEKRAALQVIYAYCRLTDDIVDMAEEKSGPEKAGALLEAWRKETVKSFREKSDHPVLAELKPVAEQFKIPEDLFQQLIDGVAMDLVKKSYASFEDLYPYCYRVASVVGLMCLKIFGCESASSKEYAVNLGIAFQLTNILRDVRTDAERGRVYLPEEDLRKFAISRDQIISFAIKTGPIPDMYRDLAKFEGQRAEHFYRKARQNLAGPDRANLIAAEVMCAVYHSILAKIRARPFSALKQKMRLSKTELFLRVAQGWTANKLRL